MPAIPPIIAHEALRRIIVNLADKVDIITTPSQSMKELIEQYGITKEIMVIPNAIDIDTFHKKDEKEIKRLKKELKLFTDDILIVYVGRVSFEKNIDKIIKALALLRDKKITNFQFMVVGEGTALEDIKNLVQSLNLTEKVRFVGAVDMEQVGNYYQIADIFAFSSTSETFGMVIIEALASGLPVLAVRAPGAVDIITDGVDGILAENDITDFAKHLANLIQHRDLREKISQNAFRTARLYSIDTVSDQVLALYHRLMEQI